MDQGSCIYPLNQADENAIEHPYLRLTEAIHIGQEQACHLPCNLDSPRGRSIRYSSIQFRD
jgi:hypothetical protein